MFFGILSKTISRIKKKNINHNVILLFFNGLLSLVVKTQKIWAQCGDDCVLNHPVSATRKC